MVLQPKNGITKGESEKTLLLRILYPQYINNKVVQTFHRAWNRDIQNKKKTQEKAGGVKNRKYCQLYPLFFLLSFRGY